MSNNKRWLVVIAGFIMFLALLVGIAWVAGEIIRQTTVQALSPFTQANNQIKTQVSQLLHPTPTIIPDPVTIIHEIRSLARLETIQYSVEKVITAETGQEFGFLFGDKLLFVAHGTVIAGVDLAKMNNSDLLLKGGVLNVRLPEVEVFVSTLNNDQSYVYNRGTGLLTRGDPTLETKARQVAEQEILKAAVSDGILTQARTNAENYLVRLFRALGYNEVLFVPVVTSTP